MRRILQRSADSRFPIPRLSTAMAGLAVAALWGALAALPAAAQQAGADPHGEVPLVAVNQPVDQVAEIDERAAVMAYLHDPDAQLDGQRTFSTHCSECHGITAKGGGGTMGAGPNLTDDQWLHGNRLADILHTITNGVTGKAMPIWGAKLGPERIHNVALYVFLLNEKRRREYLGTGE